MVFVSMFAAVAVSIVYANHVGRTADERATQNLQQMCGIVSTLDDTYRAQPPTTPTGIRVAEQMHNLRISLKCK
jgi:hypothetical protein